MEESPPPGGSPARAERSPPGPERRGPSDRATRAPGARNGSVGAVASAGDLGHRAPPSPLKAAYPPVEEREVTADAGGRSGEASSAASPTRLAADPTAADPAADPAASPPLAHAPPRLRSTTEPPLARAHVIPGARPLTTQEGQMRDAAPLDGPGSPQQRTVHLSGSSGIAQASRSNSAPLRRIHSHNVFPSTLRGSPCEASHGLPRVLVGESGACARMPSRVDTTALRPA